MNKKLYLAGKIRGESGNWRFIDSELEPGFRPAEWRVTRDAFAVGNYVYDYCGPYRFDCGHGTSWDSPHATIACCDEPVTEKRITSLCMTAIRWADLVFAWIDDPTCYGTLAEIGFAKALGKEIWIGGPRQIEDFWFIYQMASKTCFSAAMSAEDVFAQLHVPSMEQPATQPQIRFLFNLGYTGTTELTKGEAGKLISQLKAAKGWK